MSTPSADEIREQFEQRVSAQRKAVYDELDALTEELVVRYQAEHAVENGDEQ